MVVFSAAGCRDIIRFIRVSVRFVCSTACHPALYYNMGSFIIITIIIK